ncbi:CrcB family protein [Naumannella sp. ID2617S]|nr:CrcB family protein [Naumannella sp. ID2617S]
MTVLAVIVGGAIGAVLRYCISHWLGAGGGIPWGTLLVNLAGSFLLGCVLGAGLPGWLLALLGTGFCGGLTTFSTFSVELLELAGRRAWLSFLAYAAGSVLLGLLACWAGISLVSG